MRAEEGHFIAKQPVSGCSGAGYRCWRRLPLMYAGAAVTELGIGLAALVYGAGLLLVAAFGGPNGWPYGLVHPTVPVLDAGGVHAR